MKIFTLYTTLAIAAFITACDVQSGMSKKGVEKYTTTPTPAKTAVPEAPIDPADVVTVDTTLAGPQISINKMEAKKVVNCDKYNRVAVNGDGREVTIKGVCKQLMINGDNNKVTAEAISEIVVNGTENTVQYTKYANGKRPVIAENAPGNTIGKQ